MQLTCLYHPTLPMQLTDDEDKFNKMIASGHWFENHLEAKKVRELYERKINEEKRLHPEGRKRRGNSKTSTSNG